MFNRILFILTLSFTLLAPSAAFSDAVRKVTGDFPAKTVTYEAGGQVVAKEVYDTEFSCALREGAIPDGLVKEYYSTGKIRLVQNYKGGKLDGTAREYYVSGKIREERSYRNGDRDGISREYDENGRLKNEAFYKEGLLWGPVKRSRATGFYTGSALYLRYAALAVWVISIIATFILSVRRNRSTTLWLIFSFIAGPLALILAPFFTKVYDKMNYSYPYSKLLEQSSRASGGEKRPVTCGITVIGGIETGLGMLSLLLTAVLIGSLLTYGIELGIAIISLAGYAIGTAVAAFFCLLTGGHTLRFKESGRVLSLVLAILVGIAGLLRMSSMLLSESFLVYFGLISSTPKSLMTFSSTILYALALAILYYFTRPEVRKQFN